LCIYQQDLKWNCYDSVAAPEALYHFDRRIDTTLPAEDLSLLFDLHYKNEEKFDNAYFESTKKCSGVRYHNNNTGSEINSTDIYVKLHYIREINVGNRPLE
jgi:hypothetical protein